MIELVRQAQESKSRTQDLANRAAVVLTAVALGGGALTLFIWLALTEQEFSFALELDGPAILRLAAAVEAHSEHPIAKGIVAGVEKPPAVSAFRAIPGKGALGQVEGQEIQNLLWATGYNSVAIPLAAGVLYTAEIILTPAMGAVLMSLSTVIVAINARLLRMS